MITRCSAVIAISLVRWLETSTVRPWSARSFRSVRIQSTPSGSSPLTGSSRTTAAGSPRRARDSEPLAHPEREAARATARDVLQTHHREDLVDPGRRNTVRLGQREQMMPSAASPVERPRLQERTDLAQRCPLVGVAAPANGGAAGSGTVKSGDHPHGGGLAGAVGSQESGDLTGADRERQVVDGEGVAVSLRQSGDLYHASTLETDPPPRRPSEGGSSAQSRTPQVGHAPALRHRSVIVLRAHATGSTVAPSRGRGRRLSA